MAIRGKMQMDIGVIKDADFKSKVKSSLSLACLKGHCTRSVIIRLPDVSSLKSGRKPFI